MNIELLTTIFVAVVIANIFNQTVVNPILGKFFLRSEVGSSKASNLSGSANSGRKV